MDCEVRGVVFYAHVVVKIDLQGSWQSFEASPRPLGVLLGYLKSVLVHLGRVLKRLGGVVGSL